MGKKLPLQKPPKLKLNDLPPKQLLKLRLRESLQRKPPLKKLQLKLPPLKPKPNESLNLLLSKSESNKLTKASFQNYLVDSSTSYILRNGIEMIETDAQKTNPKFNLNPSHH